MLAWRSTAVVGARYLAHATSLRRVLPAGFGDGGLDRTFATMVPVALTSRTLTDKAAIRHVVLEVLAAGFATK